MKTLIKVFTIILCANSLSGQNYCNQNENISLEGFNIELKIQSQGGLIVDYIGEGTYEIIDGNFMVIHAQKPTKSSNKVSKVVAEGSLETVYFSLKDLQGNPIIGANIELLDHNDELLHGVLSDLNGRAEIAYDTSYQYARIKTLGFQESQIKLDHSEKYDIQLADGTVIEDKRVILKLEKHNENNFQFYLLDMVPNNETIDWDKMKAKAADNTTLLDARPKHKLKKCNN